MTGPADERRPRLVVDVHNHVKWYGYNARRLVENMDQFDIDLTWLLTWEAPPHEIKSGEVFWPGRYGMPLEDVIDAVEQCPDRFVPFYAPDPRRPDAMERLQGAVQYHGIRGVGEMKCRIMMDDPHALHMWHYCGEQGLPVVFHMDVPMPEGDPAAEPGYWYCCGWENLARALGLCPDTAFLGHAPGFWRGISGDAAEAGQSYPDTPVTPGGRLWEFMDSFPNLHCDLSAGSAYNALTRSPEVGKQFLQRYQDRCLFGRDYFDDRMQQFIRGGELPAEAERKIMGENALRLVPLS
jgi:predicted TIM-barrel fold metal-dependent hydrolase